MELTADQFYGLFNEMESEDQKLERVVGQNRSICEIPIYISIHEKARLYYKPILRTMVSGYYDFMKIRIAYGNRLAAMIFRKLGFAPGEKIYKDGDDEDGDDDQIEEGTINEMELYEILKKQDMTPHIEVELDDDEAEEKRKKEDKEKNKMLNKIKAEYARLADGIVDYMRKSNIKMSGKKVQKVQKIPMEVLDKYISQNGHLLTERSAWQMMIHYEMLMAEEKTHLKEIGEYLTNFPVWNMYLKNVPGIGPSLAGMMLSYVDIIKADTISKLYGYFGVDTVEDPDDPNIRHGRSNHTIHLIDRDYIDKNGNLQTKKSLKYNKKLKTKISGVMPGVLIQSNPHYRKIYSDYRFRLTQQSERFTPDRVVFAMKNGKIKLDKNDKAIVRPEFPPARLTAMAHRYMVKMFLKNMWLSWRKIEGLPITISWEEKKLGMDTSKHVDPWAYVENVEIAA